MSQLGQDSITDMEEMTQESQLTTDSTLQEDSQLTFEELEEVVASPGSDNEKTFSADCTDKEGEVRKRYCNNQ